MAPSTKTSKPSKNVPMAAKKSSKKKSRTPRGSYATFINRVLKQVHPGMSISKKSMAIMDDLVHDIFEKIADSSKELLQIEKKPTLQPSEVQQAIKFVLPGELGAHGVSEGTKALTKYMSATGKFEEK